MLMVSNSKNERNSLINEQKNSQYYLTSLSNTLDYTNELEYGLYGLRYSFVSVITKNFARRLSLPSKEFGSSSVLRDAYVLS